MPVKADTFHRAVVGESVSHCGREPLGKVFHRDSVGPGGSAVGFDSRPSHLDDEFVNNLLPSKSFMVSRPRLTSRWTPESNHRAGCFASASANVFPGGRTLLRWFVRLVRVHRWFVPCLVTFRPSRCRWTWRIGTTTFADDFDHGDALPRPPRLSGKLYSRVRMKLSPNKGRSCCRSRTRDLSPPKFLIYLRSLFRFGFAVSSQLTWSRRPQSRFLFVTWWVLARMWPAALFRPVLTHTFAGFLSTVCHLAAVALASYSLLRAIHLV